MKRYSCMLAWLFINSIDFSYYRNASFLKLTFSHLKKFMAWNPAYRFLFKGVFSAYFQGLWLLVFREFLQPGHMGKVQEDLAKLAWSLAWLSLAHCHRSGSGLV